MNKPISKRKAGLYLHVPFCRRKCKYCDFYSLSSHEMMSAYFGAAQRQMEKWAVELPGRLDSVYVGGGTPTILDGELLEGLLGAIPRFFQVEDGAEWTVEANPATVDEKKLRMLRRCGVNRISFGVQSVHEKELAALGRIHSFADARESIGLARHCGFENISADLMFGIPHQSLSSLRESILAAAELGVTHISLYGLRIEEGTPFAACIDTLPLPGEDAEREMYLSSVEWLRDCGYLQYEISNFSKPGYKSRHNLRYWMGEDYYGIGPGAHSYLAGRRFAVPPDLAAYCHSDCLSLRTVFAKDPPMTKEERMEEQLILRLRLTAGIGEEIFSAFSEKEKALSLFAKWQTLGLAAKKSGQFSFTPEGMLVSNTLLSDLLLCL